MKSELRTLNLGKGRGLPDAGTPRRALKNMKHDRTLFFLQSQGLSTALQKCTGWILLQPEILAQSKTSSIVFWGFFPQTTNTESSAFFGVSNTTRSCQWQSARQEGLDLIFSEKANLTEMFVFTLLFNIPASGKLQELVPMACFSCSLPWQIEINIFRFLSFPWRLSLPPFPRSHKLCFGLQTINFSHYSF